MLKLVYIHNDLLHVSAKDVPSSGRQNTKDGYIKDYKMKLQKCQKIHRYKITNIKTHSLKCINVICC
jgi:hypothetical protein